MKRLQRRPQPVYLVEVPGAEGLTPGRQLRVELDQIVHERGAARPGPHYCGQAEVLTDSRLTLWLNRTTEAGQTARALLDDDILEPVLLVGPEPMILLQVS